MKGKLELNLDPSFMSFEPENRSSRFRQCRYCQTSELKELLVELEALSFSNQLPQEFFVRINGDFSAEILAKHGLLKLSSVDEAKIDSVAS